MEPCPEKYLKQYIIKKTSKCCPTWQDVNELNHAAEKMLTQAFETGDASFEAFNKTLEKIKNDTQKIGVMVSYAHPVHPTVIAIGYSLCNMSLGAGDRFDEIAVERHLLYKKAEGFGLNIALNRALDWSQMNLEVNKAYHVPPSIKETLKAFCERSQRYYKDRKLPPWVYLSLF